MTSKAAKRQQFTELVADSALSKPAIGVPRQFQFEGNRIYFLAHNGESPNIYYANFPNEEIANEVEWHPLLSQQLDNSTAAVSKEEELRRERMRATASGIVTYKFHAGTKKFLLEAAGSLFVVGVGADRAEARELSSADSGVRLDPSFSPDGKLVAYIRYNDIWVQDVTTADEKRLSLVNPQNDPHCKKGCGIAEYIMQEEFDRYSGYWWDPSPRRGTKYRILCAQIDETALPTFAIPELGLKGGVDSFIYPQVADVNADFDLSIIEFDGNDVQQATPVVKKLRPSLRQRFPWAEYMPRAGWTPDGSKIWVQLLDRKQQRWVFATIETSAFSTDASSDAASSAATEGTNTGVHILRDDTTPYWINITDLVHFFADGSGRILFASEESKYRHLYLITPNYKDGTNATKVITRGDWQVDDKTFEVDEARGLVYFMGTKDTPLESHLYVTSVAEENPKIAKLTTSNYTHNVAFSADLGMFVTCNSNVKEAHRAQVFYLSYSRSGGLPQPIIRLTLAKPYQCRKPQKFAIQPPEFFSFPNSRGETCYGAYFKPRSFDPTKKYPTILKVYGGPHVQLVTNDYAFNLASMALHLYAHLGYLCVVIDGVGSSRRGLKFEGYLRNKMGTVEVQDQIDGLVNLIKQGYVDTTRIGVYGWSYGGYLSLMCLSQRADFFKLAIAGAPVVKWEGYDTGYTERYMDTPDNNPEGYKLSAVTHYTTGFPDEPNRLLLIHNTRDENVHFAHTLELIQQLVVNNKPYQLQTFPGERHGIRSIGSAKYLDLTMLQFFNDHL